MFLSADDIAERVAAGLVLCDPFDPRLLKPASYVLRLGPRFGVLGPGSEPIRIWSEKAGHDRLTFIEATESFVLEPNVFVLATTLESVALPEDLVGFLSGLSHLARIGLSIHLDAAIVSPTFGRGCATRITLELSSHNPAPLVLQVGMPICHLALATTTRRSPTNLRLDLQRSIYEGLPSPTGTLLYEEFNQIIGRKPDHGLTRQHGEPK